MKSLKAFLALALLSATLAIPAGAVAQDQGADVSPATAGPLPGDGGAAAEIPALAPSEAEPWLKGILPEPTQGAEALELLDATTLEEVAAQNSKSTSDMATILSDDSAAWLDADGILSYLDSPTPAQYLAGEPPAAAPFPNAQTFLLHSRPGSSKVIHLDFDGYRLPADTSWQNGEPYIAQPWDIDGNDGTFNQTEHDTIQSVWQRVSEDYAPFDVDVTTEEPSFDAINRTDAADTNYGTRVVITDNPASDFCVCGGIAHVGTFDTFGGNGHEYYQPAWAFAGSVGDSAKNLAEVSSHQSGHNLGLDHDGVAGGVELYAGHGAWAPIMGSSYGRPVTQWSKGEYPNPSNTQDDFAVMNSNGLAFVPDDAPEAFSSTVDLVPGRRQLIGVAPAADVDSWRYIPACSGTYTFDVAVAPTSPNLNLDLQMWWQVGNVNWVVVERSTVATVTADVASGMGETLTHTLAAGKPYVIHVGADNHDSFPGSVGEYTITVTEPSICCLNDAYADATPLGTVGATKVTAAGDNSCATQEGGENLPGASRTVWYSFVAQNTGTATVSTCSTITEIDTVLGIYSEGATVDAATPLTSNDNPTGDAEDRCSVSGGALPSWTSAQITLPVFGGTTYMVQVSHGALQGGIFELSVQQHECGGRFATQVGSDGPDVWAAIPLGAVVVGLGGDDTMINSVGATQCGNEGNDTLSGGPDEDEIWGGPGADDIRGFGGSDFLIGDGAGAFYDVESVTDGADTIRGGRGDDDIWANGGADNVIAGDGADTIQGGSGNDSLNGGAGADVVRGYEGDDVLRGQGDVDVQFGAEGDDVMRGHAGNDIMLGGDGNDTLLAASGDDQLFGESGDDTLWAGAGADQLDGGAGTNDFCHGGSDTDVDTHVNCEILRKLF